MSATPAANLTSKDIELATRAADNFTRIYYATYDSSTRVADVPKFYRQTSSLTWNGNPKQGLEGIKELLKGIPKTRHEVQSFDCHPIPGGQPPSLLINVSGSVIHGAGPEGNPKGTARGCLDGQPRVFSQTFLLVPDPTASVSSTGEVAKYYISADSIRFVG